MSVLQKTSSITAQILTALDTAEKEILFQAYYVDNDAIFELYAKKFLAKRTQGVIIHCLFDALGASQIPGSDIEKQLIAAGVHIQYFNWLTPWANHNKKIFYFRNHKRGLIIDRKTVHTGGWCVGEKTENWIESYIVSQDLGIVEKAVGDFWNMYTYAHKSMLRFKHQKKYTFDSNLIASYAYQAPILRGRYIYYTYKKLITSATKEISIVVPYFAPIHGLKNVLYRARRRGVAISIFLPKKTDSKFVDLVARTYIYRLLKLGVHIYFSDTMIHAKASRIDDVLYVGSLNLDTASLRYNFENGIFTKDQVLLRDFEKDLYALRLSCHKVTFEEWNNRSLWERFLDRFMKIFRAFA